MWRTTNSLSALLQCNSPLIPMLLWCTVADAADSAQMRISLRVCECVCSPQWWVNESTKRVWKHTVWPLSLCCSTHTQNSVAAQTHTYTLHTRSCIPCNVPMPELAPLSMPGEHASRQQSPRKLVLLTGMAANIWRENNLNTSWKQKNIAAESSHTLHKHTHTHTRHVPKLTGRNSLLDISWLSFRRFFLKKKKKKGW